MGQISRTTNPTELKKIDKGLFIVRTQLEPDGRRVFWLERFDHLAAGISSSAHVACIAHAGSTEAYFSLGPVAEFTRQPFSLDGLARDRPLKFRFIFHEPDEPLLVGYADGVRAADESGQLGQSLVDIEPADLGGVAWKLVLPDRLQEADGKPNVLVERRLFPTAQSAARSHWFGLLVMPEVMRQIAAEIATNPQTLDDPESWPSSWWRYLNGLGVEPPVAAISDDPQAQAAWIELVVDGFAAKGALRHCMDSVIGEMEGTTT